MEGRNQVFIGQTWHTTCVVNSKMWQMGLIIQIRAARPTESHHKHWQPFPMYRRGNLSCELLVHFTPLRWCVLWYAHCNNKDKWNVTLLQCTNVDKKKTKKTFFTTHWHCSFNSAHQRPRYNGPLGRISPSISHQYCRWAKLKAVLDHFNLRPHNDPALNVIFARMGGGGGVWETSKNSIGTSCHSWNQWGGRKTAGPRSKVV